MVVTFAQIASKIAALAEVANGDSVTMDNSIPNALATQLTNQGLVVTRTNFGGLTSLNTDIVITTNSTLINKAINIKRIDRSFSFTFLIIVDEEAVEGDMEEQFEIVRKGEFEFSVGEIIHFSVWKLTRVWVNQ